MRPCCSFAALQGAEAAIRQCWVHTAADPIPMARALPGV